MIRTRVHPKNNYMAYYIDDVTERFTVRQGQPITELEYPEFYDISLGDKCIFNCHYCYATAGQEKGVVYEDVVDKADMFFGSMNMNQRPFQVAIGGDSEPTVHPEFVRFLRKLHSLGIMPNYTTAGSRATDKKFIAQIEKYSSGVAISLHPHLESLWRKAIQAYAVADVKVNLHVVVSSTDTIDYAWEILKEYHQIVDYVVALPYMSNRNAPYQEYVGGYFAETLERNKTLPYYAQMAVGANAYEQVKSGDFGFSLYEPHDFSKYLLMSDPIQIFSDSHGMIPLDEGSPLWKHTEK